MAQLLTGGVAAERAERPRRWPSVAAAVMGGSVLLYGLYRTAAMLLRRHFLQSIFS